MQLDEAELDPDAADAPVLATSPPELSPELQPLPAAPSAADRDPRDEGSI